MSADVQPRKRKDKRRRKADGEYAIHRIRRESCEDEDSGTPPPVLINPIESVNENVTIHVHKESSTGGHWCARIVFFALLAVLVGLISIIIIEHRGTTDVDTPVSESRWAAVFDGWVDESHPQEDDEHIEHDHEEEEEEEHENEEEEDLTDEERESLTEEGSKEEEEEDEAEEDDEDTKLYSKEEDEDQEENSEALNDDTGGDDDEDEGYKEGDEDDEDEEKNNYRKDNGDSAEEEYNGKDALEEMENGSDEEKSPDDNLDTDEAFEGDEDDGDITDDFFELPGVNEIDDNSAEPLEEVDGDDLEEEVNENDVEPEVEEIQEESASVAVKFGVGVALVVAAHFVLVRRWNNAIDQVPDLSRRNTLIPPSTAVQESAGESSPERRRNIEDLKSKYMNFQAENMTRTKGAFHVRQEERNMTRGRVISSEEEDNEEELETSEGERISGPEEYEDEEEEENVEEEEEVEEMEEEEEEEEITDVDDGDLIAKLEAKYGKIPTPPDSEREDDVEEEYEEEDEEEYEEEEDDDMPGWKRIKAPAGPSSTGAGATVATNVKPEQSVPRGGGKNYNVDNLFINDEIIVRETETRPSERPDD